MNNKKEQEREELHKTIWKIAKNNDNLNVVIADIFDNIESSVRGTAEADLI